MTVFKWGAVALATLLGVSTTSPASATTQQLERFGNVYAMSVCGKFSAPGDAHCFAKVVTDARGNIREWVAGPRAARNSNSVRLRSVGPAECL